jgi:hypothetical protein
VPHPQPPEPLGIENLDCNNDDHLGGPASTLAAVLGAADEGFVDLNDAR